ncbi:MAG: CvpA family protein [Campylobacterota bacterium]|nr:CvpA family protein [Campylobacterota bacterium]
MEFNYFDLIITVIVLLLGLKGIINGFFKELFGLIGIIGGIFIASRMGDTVGTAVNDALFHFESGAAVNFTGFLITLSVFWIIMVSIGLLLKKLGKMSGLGPVDRVFGFVFGSGKFFLIGSVIIYAIFNIKTIRENLEPAMENSFMFPVMVDTGGFIMHLDPVEIADDINETITDTVAITKEKIEITTTEISDATQETLQEAPEKIMEEVKEKLESNNTSEEASE